jgi:hypothetical protein
MRKILITVFLSMAILKTYACDICGCSVSNYNPFLFPHMSKAYFSAGYIHRHYYVYPNSPKSADQNFNSLLLTTQYRIGKKMHFAAMLPYQVNKLVTRSAVRNVSGAGDISILLNYNLVDKITKRHRQTVMIGGGIKLASGAYTRAKAKDIDEQNFQLGTGSTDYILNASYRLSYRKWILSTSASYKYNTANRDDYRFGDVCNAGVNLIYRVDKDQLSITPYVELSSEHQMKDAAGHALQEHSGGNVFYTGTGVDVNTKKIAVGFKYSIPAIQDLAQGMILVKPGFSSHLSFTF